MNDTTTLYKQLQLICEAAGTNISEVCREAKISDSTIRNWKKKQPDTVDTLTTFLQTVGKLDTRPDAKEIPLMQLISQLTLEENVEA